jgi:nitroreductase
MEVRMEAFECLITRRSVREFGQGEIDDDAVLKIVTAAMHAPSAGNQRPWHFIVIRDRGTLTEITKIHPHAGMLKQAQLAIAVAADRDSEKYPGYWVIDCAAATQNLLLAVHALGLGAVWLGIHPREDRSKGLAELLKFPPNVVPHSLVAVGIPAAIPPQPERFEEEKIHYEKW